ADALILPEFLDLRGFSLAIGEPRSDLRALETYALARVLVYAANVAHHCIRTALVTADRVEALDAVGPLALALVGTTDIRLLGALVDVDDVNDH
ncbi:hypothetical protein PMAYCL1PPCAC_08173, partial [Pristionchus mayeri]